MQTRIKIGGEYYDIEISELEENLLKIKINDTDYFFAENELGELVSVEKQTPSDLVSPELETIPLQISGKEIKAPIAGTVSAICVKEGERVKPNQKVMVLISMKMENEIVSESYGKIKKIKVTKDQNVKKEETLILLE